MRRWIVMGLMVAFVGSLNAQDMASVFTEMPDQYIPQLEHAWRKDLVDLYNSGKEARLKNTMNGVSILRSLTNDYLFLETTERSTVELKLLPLVNNTYIVCMVSTVNGPVPDSRIEFFTTEWMPIATSDLLTRPEEGWYLKEGIDKSTDAYQDAVARLDMDLVQYSLSADDMTLTLTYTTPQYLNQDEQEKLQPYLGDPIVYKWEKYHFNLQMSTSL